MKYCHQKYETTDMSLRSKQLSIFRVGEQHQIKRTATRLDPQLALTGQTQVNVIIFITD